jgi:hypothetical protein
LVGGEVVGWDVRQRERRSTGEPPSGEAADDDYSEEGEPCAGEKNRPREPARRRNGYRGR